MIDLTAIFRKHGILRISDTSPARDGSSFSAYLRGGIVGTGKSVGDALNSALRTRDLQSAHERHAA